MEIGSKGDVKVNSDTVVQRSSEEYRLGETSMTPWWR